MSLPRETMIELMALADGELDGAARERAERLVAESDEARQVVEAIRGSRLGVWLGEATAARTAAADGIADAVMARLDGGAAASPAREEGGVVRLAAPRKVRSGSRMPALAAGVAVALAAGVAVVVRAVQVDATAPAYAPAPVASVEVPSSLGSPLAAPSIALAQQGAGPKQGVEVDEIDSPSRGVSVFEIPLGSAAAAAASAGPSSVVIWIDDEQGGK